MRQDMYGVIWILIRTKEIAFEKMLQSCNYDPTEIGKIMLENLANLQTKGAVSMHPGQDVDPEADKDEV